MEATYKVEELDIDQIEREEEERVRPSLLSLARYRYGTTPLGRQAAAKAKRRHPCIRPLATQAPWI